jgi:hypothetical protein
MYNYIYGQLHYRKQQALTLKHWPTCRLDLRSKTTDMPMHVVLFLFITFLDLSIYYVVYIFIRQFLTSPTYLITYLLF